VEVIEMKERKWWVTFCPTCGKWRQARPANPWWTKSPNEVEVSDSEFAELQWKEGGTIRDWYIGETLTRLVNEHRCK
jgi:hypothetical protein